MHARARVPLTPVWILTALAALTFASPALGAVTAEQALLENGTFAEFDQVNTAAGKLTNTTQSAYEGRRSASATYDGGGANGYSRGLWETNWANGEDVWYGAAYYLPSGFKANMQGQVDLLRWDNYSVDPNQTDRSGVVIYGSSKRAYLVRARLGVEQVELVGPFDLPEGRWFHLEVHQKLSGGSGAVSEVYLDGKRVGSSTKANSYGRPVTRVRYGLVAMAAGAQKKPLSLLFDKATVGTRQVGATLKSTAASEEATATVSEPGATPKDKKKKSKKRKKRRSKHRKH